MRWIRLVFVRSAAYTMLQKDVKLHLWRCLRAQHWIRMASKILFWLACITIMMSSSFSSQFNFDQHGQLQQSLTIFNQPEKLWPSSTNLKHMPMENLWRAQTMVDGLTTNDVYKWETQNWWEKNWLNVLHCSMACNETNRRHLSTSKNVTEKQSRRPTSRT